MTETDKNGESSGSSQESSEKGSETRRRIQEDKDVTDREEIMDSRKINKEINDTVSRPLSGSSTGSLPPCNEYNPFVKAQSQHRKDFQYVTELRKEVIQIVEPYRSRVLTFDERIKACEKLLLD